MNIFGRAMMDLIDMPMDIGADKLEVKELVKREAWDILHMHEKPKIVLKSALVVINCDWTLSERCITTRDQGTGGPGLKRCEALLQRRRPVAIGQGRPMMGCRFSPVAWRSCPPGVLWDQGEVHRGKELLTLSLPQEATDGVLGVTDGVRAFALGKLVGLNVAIE